MSNIKRINSIFNGRMNKKIADFNLKGQQQALKGKKTFTPITLSEGGLETIEFLSLDCTSPEFSAPWHGTALLKSSSTNSAMFGKMVSMPKKCGMVQLLLLRNH